MSVRNSRNLIRVRPGHLREHQRIARDFFIQHHNVYELFHDQVQKQPEKVFVIFPQQGQVFSYQDLDCEVEHRSRYLRDRGLTKGERVALVLPTSPDFLALYFAAFRQGLSVVPINPDLSAAEIAYIITDSHARAVFYHQLVSAEVLVAQKISGLDQKVFVNISDLLADHRAGDSSPVAVSYQDEAVVIYTSGTTGKPKGAVLNHLSLLADAEAISSWFKFEVATRTLGILPLFHNNGQVVTLLAPLSVGGSTVLVPSKTSLRLFWSLVKEYAISWTSVMPSILAIILATRLKRTDSTMVGIICGGQVLNQEVKTQFEDRYQVTIFEGYGLTETTSFACFNRFPAKRRKSGSVGEALPCNDIIILGEDDQELARGEEGEICIRGPNVMSGYLGLPELNQQVLRAGFFHSGDYGYLDDDGHLYFKTRKDYLISKGGEKIYPSEIENVLFAHPAVDECAVIGVPDQLLGQEIVAFVKLGREATKGELAEFFAGKLAHHKHPKEIIVVNQLADLGEIPKGPTKKVLYRVLADYYQRRLQP